MVYSPAFAGMPPELKSAVLGQMRHSLAPGASVSEYAYLGEAEKLRALLPLVGGHG